MLSDFSKKYDAITEKLKTGDHKEKRGIRIIWWKRAYNSPFSNFLISVEKSTP